MFKSIKIFILGIIAVLIGVFAFLQGDSGGGLIWCSLGILAIVSYLPAWEIGRFHVTYFAQGALCGLLALTCLNDILNGDPDLYIRYFVRMTIPYGNYLGVLILGGLFIVGLLAAFGLIKRE